MDIVAIKPYHNGNTIRRLQMLRHLSHYNRAEERKIVFPKMLNKFRKPSNSLRQSFIPRYTVLSGEASPESGVLVALNSPSVVVAS